MPRDTSGNYTLPLGNPVVDGTIIEAPWANDTMEDIAVQLNGVYTRDGKLGPLAPFLVLDGTVAVPGLGFVNSTSTGLWYNVTSAGYSYGGVAHWTSSLGSIVFGVPPQYAADPATANTLARKSYIDTKFVPLTGATLSGPLTLRYASPAFNFDALASGQASGANYFTAWVLRWSVLKSNTAESGSDLGSNFNITRYTDLGVSTLALRIARDSGQVSMYGDVVVQPPTTLVSRTMYVSGISGSSAAYALRDGAVVRWQLGKVADNTFGIYRYDATGAVLDAPVTINQATGIPAFLNGLSASGPITTSLIQSSGPLSISADGVLIGIGSNALFPSVDNLINLGGTVNRYKEAHATTFVGNLQGNATTASAVPTTGLTGASGTYTPTFSVATVLPTANPCNWMRVGNMVTVTGYATTTNMASSLTCQMSLPIASDLQQFYDLTGTANYTAPAAAGAPLSVTANTTTNTATFNTGGSPPASSATIYFMFMYKVQ